MSFTFDVGFSTSAEKTIAGQPSDVILGGGANLRVLTAIEVSLNPGDIASATKFCVSGNTTYEWLPEQVTTYVLSVYEIENTMNRIASLDQTASTKLAIANWVKVLSDYRAGTATSSSPARRRCSRPTRPPSRGRTAAPTSTTRRISPAARCTI